MSSEVMRILQAYGVAHILPLHLRESHPNVWSHICELLSWTESTQEQIDQAKADRQKEFEEEGERLHHDFLASSRWINFNLQETQAETFFAAFETRFLGKSKISALGRKNFRDLAAQGKLKTVMKYALAQPMARLTRFGSTPVCEMPPVPKGYEAYADSEFLIMDILKLTGTTRMRLYSHLTELTADKSRPTKRAIKWCFELTQMKNICPKLTFLEVADAIKDHHDTLTDATNPEVSGQVERIVNTICQSIFPPIITYNSLPPGTLTDRSALIERCRDADALSTLKLRSGQGFKAHVSGLDEAPQSDQTFHRMISHALAMDSLQEMSVPVRQSTHFIPELRARPSRLDTEDEIMEPYLDPSSFSTDENRAHIVALLEPLKVRTISIDSGILRYLASRLQKYLWNTLSKFPVFDLIRGVSVEDTLEFMIRGLPFVSGDYKGATDSIFHNSTDLWVHQIFSRLAIPSHLSKHFEAIKRDFTRVLLDYSNTYDQEGRMFLKAWCMEKEFLYDFTGKSFWDAYSDLVTDFPELYGLRKHLLADNTVVRQARGQLMGNVLSFPILCLINLTGYLVAAERFVNVYKYSDISDPADQATWNLLTEFFSYGKGGKRRLMRSPLLLRRLPVRVNGDDILFQGSRRFYQIWSDAIKDVGFQKSVGKNYFSEYFFTVNSQIFVPRDEGTDMYSPYKFTPERMNHIWWSGLTPDFLRRRTDFRSLVGKDSATIADSRMFLAPVQAEFLKTVPIAQRDTWNRLFLSNNREFIESFDSFGKPLSKDKKVKGHFRVSRSLPIKLGGLGLELPEKEELTYSQRILALRLLNDDSCPYRLGESPLINTLLRPYREYLENRYPVRNVTRKQREELEVNNRVVDLTEFCIQATARLYPFWREPPPDDIAFRKEALASFTEKVFRWALTCRRGLKKIAEEVDFSSDFLRSLPLDRVVIFPLQETF
jgi:hypothetical protein